jgi:hypothetical protein
MSISLTCECGRQIETRESNVGRNVRCPGCGREHAVPKPSLFLEDECVSELAQDRFDRRHSPAFFITRSVNSSERYMPC